MSHRWKKRPVSTRHADPDAAIAGYLEELRQAERAGAPTPAAALNGIGDAHLDKGDVVSAVDHYRQAAEVYERTGMHDNAIACCKKIRRHVPQDLGVRLVLGRLYAAKGLTADALASLEEYVDGQLRAGGRLEAIEALREVVRLAPERAEHREQLERLVAEDDRRDAAGAPAAGEVMVEREPPDDGTAGHLATAAARLREAGRWPEAVLVYRRLAQLEQAAPGDFAAWAECARQSGEASSLLEALAASARWHLACGDREGARRAAEEILLVDPDSAVATEVLDRLGMPLPRG